MKIAINLKSIQLGKSIFPVRVICGYDDNFTEAELLKIYKLFIVCNGYISEETNNGYIGYNGYNYKIS